MLMEAFIFLLRTPRPAPFANSVSVLVTFTEYLHTLRVGRAASLLAATSMSITDIAIDVGFDHTRTFTRAFKDVKGTTPKQFRAVHQLQLPGK